MRAENWVGHEIRFAEKSGEWWAVAKDVADALNYDHIPTMIRKVSDKYKGVHPIHTLGGIQSMAVLSEHGLYKIIMQSNKTEAEDFQEWVCEVIKQLRQSVGLEGFHIFRMLDKEHQKAAMQKLNQSLSNPARVDFIKANTIANKAVSTLYSHPKMLKKDQMTPDMLVQREPILDDTVALMATKDSFKLDLSVSQNVYHKYCFKQRTA